MYLLLVLFLSIILQALFFYLIVIICKNFTFIVQSVNICVATLHSANFILNGAKCVGPIRSRLVVFFSVMTIDETD